MLVRIRTLYLFIAMTSKSITISNVDTCVASRHGDSSGHQDSGGNNEGLHDVCDPGVRVTLDPVLAGGNDMWSGRLSPSCTSQWPWTITAAHGQGRASQHVSWGGALHTQCWQYRTAVTPTTNSLKPECSYRLPASAWYGYIKEGSPELYCRTVRTEKFVTTGKNRDR